jgi:hypothetical protein
LRKLGGGHELRRDSGICCLGDNSCRRLLAGTSTDTDTPCRPPRRCRVPHARRLARASTDMDTIAITIERQGVADLAISQRKLEATRTARTARLARAEARASDLAPLIAELRASGVTTLQGIADGFNRSSIPTPRGRGEWQAPQVRRLLVRLRFLSDKPAGADVIGQ